MSFFVCSTCISKSSSFFNAQVQKLCTPSVCEIFYLSSFTVCYILITNLSRMSDNCLILPICDIFLTFLIQKSFIEYTSVIRKWQFMDVFFVIDRCLLEDESYDFFYCIYTGFDPISATCRSIKATSLYIYYVFIFHVISLHGLLQMCTLKQRSVFDTRFIHIDFISNLFEFSEY